jgi:hypothetical protein
MEEGEHLLMHLDSFVEKYRPKEYSQKNYLVCTYRYSLIEKVISKYLFQFSCHDYSLYQLILKLYHDQSAKELFISFLNFFIKRFEVVGPLHFFPQISKEILKIFDIKDLYNIKFTEFILKLEFLLAWHFESNFYPNTAIYTIIDSYNDNVNLQNGVTNYIYSFESLNTIEHFVKVFEKQNLCTRIEGNLSLITNFFCTEKVYNYAYKKKETTGNIIKYLLEQLNVKMSKNKKNKINSKEMENYIMMNLYFVDKIIQNYTFYLSKDPELIDIFNNLEVFRSFPCPISNYSNRVRENIINEYSFQGILLLNKLRQIYYLDLMDNDITVIDTKLFKYTLVIHSKEWEKRHTDDQNNYFNVVKFINYLKNKPKKKKNNKLIIKEILIKLLITFIYNSELKYNENTFRKIYQLYMENYDKIYDDNNNDIENDKVKKSFDKLIKIIDVGFDKPVNDFNKEINIVANKIFSTIYSKNTITKEYKDSIMDNDFYLPINSMRNYLKPNYTDFQTLYKEEDKVDKNSNDFVNIFDKYIKIFKEVVNKYFKFFLTSSKDELVEKNLVVMRKNFFQNFRINILLFEEENTIIDLIENLRNNIFNVIESKISNDDFNNFWKFFVDNKKEVIPKFLLFIVPYYERPTSNPFRILTEENSLKTKENYLSEFIANNDYLYKNLIFMPFASSCDPIVNNFVNKSPDTSDDIMSQPPLKMLYSPFKKCLDYYLGDSTGLFNLYLYKVTINDNLMEKIFFKNIEILEVANDMYKNTKITMTCVDYLGIEHKKATEINLSNSAFNIKIFNLFYKNNIPFNYQMTSNRGWLEMFIDDKYDYELADKFCNFQSFIRLNKESKYYEEFNLPQVEIESRFQNYKVKNVLIESSSPSIIIRCDDYMDMDYGEKIDLGSLAKNNMELKLRIKIEPFCVNDQRYTIPIATFITI